MSLGHLADDAENRNDLLYPSHLCSIFVLKFSVASFRIVSHVTLFISDILHRYRGPPSAFNLLIPDEGAGMYIIIKMIRYITGELYR